MNYHVSLPLVLLAALTEASVLPMFRVAGLQPNLVMVLLVAWLMVRGPSEAFVLIPFAGVMQGLVDSAPLGTALLALAPIASLQEARGAQLREGGFVLTLMFVVVMTFVYQGVYLSIYTLMGQSGGWLDAATRAMIPSAFLNVVVLAPIYVFLTITRQDLRRVTYV